MNFIRKIFENRIDDEVHKQFKRFSRGKFENRAAVEISVSKQVKIKTSFEYTNWFVNYLANTAKDSVHINGGIITTKIINAKGLEIANVKQFAGVKTYQVDTNITRDNLIGLINGFPEALFCLSFSTEYGSLKVKVKTPKASKPGKDDTVKADYCTFVTKDLSFKNEFTFDFKENFKDFRVSHDFIIEELVVPEEYKNDLDKARIYAKRKGKIIRKIRVDGKEIVKEASFEA